MRILPLPIAGSLCTMGCIRDLLNQFFLNRFVSIIQYGETCFGLVPKVHKFLTVISF